MPWGAAAAATVVGAYISSEASRDASKKQQEAARQSMTAQERMYEQQREDQQPFREAGVDAVNKLRQLLNAQDSSGLTHRFDANDLNSDVVYNTGLDFGLRQGISGINSRAAQSGSYDSGATLKALTRYANDYGNTKANEAYNRYNTDQNNIYNRLAGMSGMGQTATGQTQAAGTNMVNNVSSSLADAGNARAAGIVGEANAWNSALGSLSGAYGNYKNQKWLESLGKNKSSSPSNDDILQSIYYGQ